MASTAGGAALSVFVADLIYPLVEDMLLLVAFAFELCRQQLPA